MPSIRIWGRLLGVDPAVVETVGFDEAEQVVVVGVRVRRRDRARCGGVLAAVSGL
ncbi:hypothetical protein Acsp05_59420 [Actinokineospora sp. NBRC 105648]|nr:hypothetical protein Acsp05_59420 [Actinokineospora sp. NBRC 105648]